MNVMPMPIMDPGYNMGMPQQQQSRSMTMPNNNSMGGFNNMPIVVNNGEHREPQVYILSRSVPALILSTRNDDCQPPLADRRWIHGRLQPAPHVSAAAAAAAAAVALHDNAQQLQQLHANGDARHAHPANYADGHEHGDDGPEWIALHDSGAHTQTPTPLLPILYPLLSLTVCSRSRSSVSAPTLHEDCKNTLESDALVAMLVGKAWLW